MSREQWKQLLQFLVTVLTAIIGTLGLQSCL
jgi:hypothetical protein